MTRAISSPQSVTISDLLLVVTADVLDPGIKTEFLAGDPDGTIYPDAVGYVRWGLEPAGGGGGGGGYQVVTGEFDQIVTSGNDLRQTQWWGSESSAEALAQQLGDEWAAGGNSLGQPNGGFFGPWLAYGEDQNGSIQVVSYEGTSGNITSNFVVNPDQVESFLFGSEDPPPEPVRYFGPWLPIHQQETAVPVNYSGSLNLFFEAIERLGVVITAEFVNL